MNLLLVFCLSALALVPAQEILLTSPWYTGQQLEIVDDIFYPCADLNDLQCIREYLNLNSDCNPNVYGTVPEQSTSWGVEFELPYFNITQKAQYQNNYGIANCSVSALYFNRTSEITVMSIDCPGLSIESERRTYWHRPGQQDLEYQFKLTAQYCLTTLTVNLRNPKNLDICAENAYAYVHFLPAYQVLPRDYETDEFIREDPTGIMRRHLDVWAREVILHQSSNIFRSYVSAMICDFGCPTCQICAC